MNSEVSKIAIFCEEKLELNKTQIIEEYNYQSLPLCVIDSIFSIGVKYESVKNVIKNVGDFLNIKTHNKTINEFPLKSDQISVSEFRNHLSNLNFEELSTKIFKNKQRTSTKNGILKSEAVIKFLDVLIKYNVEFYEDVQVIFENKSFEKEIQKIPGQASGISLKYFFMLAGNDNMIKPDRMIVRFLSSILNRDVKTEECLPLLLNVTSKLNKEGYIKLTPKILDNKIWVYQRNLK